MLSSGEAKSSTNPLSSSPPFFFTCLRPFGTFVHLKIFVYACCVSYSIFFSADPPSQETCRDRLHLLSSALFSKFSPPPRVHRNQSVLITTIEITSFPPPALFSLSIFFMLGTLHVILLIFVSDARIQTSGHRCFQNNSQKIMFLIHLFRCFVFLNCEARQRTVQHAKCTRKIEKRRTVESKCTQKFCKNRIFDKNSFSFWVFNFKIFGFCIQ